MAADVPIFGGEFGSGDTLKDMWTRPDPERAEVHDIFAYALTVDGYFYAQAVLHSDLRKDAPRLLAKWRGAERANMSFVELRLLLFWEQRAAHHLWQGGAIRTASGDGEEKWVALKSGPDENDTRHLRELHQAICAAWDREGSRRLVLVALRPDMVAAWREAFNGYDDVAVRQGSIFEAAREEGCNALVSPANSYGFLDGGLDLQISQFFGWHVQDRLQELIRTKHHGELLVGSAEIVPTDHSDIPYVIAAPTMRVPMILDETVNVYLATRALILLVRHGHFEDGRPIAGHVRAVAIPAMGAGVGGVPPRICARQMKAAVDDALYERSPFPTSWHDAQTRHQLLYGDDARDLQYP